MDRLDNMYKLGILGVGKMGSAILEGVIKSNVYSANEIAIYTLEDDIKAKYKKMGCNIAINEADLFENSKSVLIAIKPQMFNDVLACAKSMDFTDKCIISIAAGQSIKTVESFFKNATVVRVMPNTPALIQAASTAICYNRYNDDVKKAKEIFLSIGAVEEIEENQMNESLPLNGSMPAYLYLFAKAFIENGVKLGIDYEVSKRLCCNAIIGSAKMILESSDDIDTLIKNVCSKGGTTIAGLDKLYENEFEHAIDECYTACVNRAIELNNK